MTVCRYPMRPICSRGHCSPSTHSPQGGGEWGGVAVKEPSAGPTMPGSVGLPPCHQAALAAVPGDRPAVRGDRRASWSFLSSLPSSTPPIRAFACDCQANRMLSEDVNSMDRDRFEIYKNTQQELLLKRQVLLSALRKPEVKDIPIVQYQTQYGDPIDWLMKRLSVTFPEKAEVMMVSLELDRPRGSPSPGEGRRGILHYRGGERRTTSGSGGDSTKWKGSAPTRSSKSARSASS